MFDREVTVVAVTTALRTRRRAVGAVSLPIPQRGRPHLVLVPGGRAPTTRPSTVVFWRRRLVAALVVVGLASALWAGLGAPGGALTVSGRSSPRASVGGRPAYVVQPGDTLWTLARRLDPHGDPRPLVDRLAAAHGGATLRVGERIALPRPLRS